MRKMTFERKQTIAPTDFEKELEFAFEAEAAIRKNVTRCEEQIRNSNISQESVAAWIQEMTDLKNPHIAELSAQERTQGIASQQRQAKTDFAKNSSETYQWMYRAIETMQVMHPCAVGAFCRPATFTTTDAVLWVDHDFPTRLKLSHKSKEKQTQFFARYLRLKNELEKTDLVKVQQGAKILFLELNSARTQTMIVMVRFLVHHAFGDVEMIPGGKVVQAMMRVPAGHLENLRKAVRGNSRHHEMTFLRSV